MLPPPASEYLIPVRLVNGSDSHSGAVEVRLPGDQVWGSVCDLFFNIQDAAVICRQLGFEGTLCHCYSTVYVPLASSYLTRSEYAFTLPPLLSLPTPRHPHTYTQEHLLPIPARTLVLEPPGFPLLATWVATAQSHRWQTVRVRPRATSPHGTAPNTPSPESSVSVGGRLRGQG